MDLEHIFDGPPVTQKAILESRTCRARRQQELLRRGFPCLVSFSLNIPGPIKQFPLARRTFQEGLCALRQSLSPHVIQEEVSDRDSGCEALLCTDLPPQQVKERTAALEECHPLGRLFDMDVLDPCCVPLSRAALGFPPRRCMLCGQDAKTCARSQAHSLRELQLHIAQVLERYFRNQAADNCAACATRALLYEVSTTPKPGLVDRGNSGTHQDMDFFTFLDSSAALSPWFRTLFCIGWDHARVSPPAQFQYLRFAGRQAEQAMMHATGGVNTHKGLIFSLGLLCGALGSIQSHSPAVPVPLDRVLDLCQEFGRCALSDFSMQAAADTHGMQCFHKYSALGIRGEAAQGFPCAVKVGLPALRHWLSEGLCLNDAAAIALLSLLAQTSDTNMIYRGGPEKARQCQLQAQSLLFGITKDNFRSILEQLDRRYIRENLSPGGCADLLAVSLMLLFLEQEGLVVL